MDSFISADGKAIQRAAVLAALREGPLSSVRAREDLGILHVPARIHELRRAGYDIKTLSRVIVDAAGRPHKCAVYLLGEPQ